jgi:hypothetical protein
MASKFEKKSSKSGLEKIKSWATGRRSEKEVEQDLSPLDIIKQDTDVLSEDENTEYVFRMPPAPLEIADYLGHYLVPSEVVRTGTEV